MDLFTIVKIGIIGIVLAGIIGFIYLIKKGRI